MLSLVMSVDDDSMVQMLSEIILSDHQFCRNILKIQDGKMALDYFEGQKKLSKEDRILPELLLLDINMPVMDGWDFLDLYQKEYSDMLQNMKIVLLTSGIDPDEEQKATIHPLVFKYITKPLEPRHIAELKNHPAFAENFSIS